MMSEDPGTYPDVPDDYPMKAEAIDALKQIDRALAGRNGMSFPTVSETCEQYQTIKPLVESATWLISLIPIYGPPIVLALRFLMGIADRVCQVETAPSAWPEKTPEKILSTPQHLPEHERIWQGRRK